MERLWAPWRMAYIAPKTPQPQECIFCTQPAENRDEEHHILYRGERCFMMLNLYPYNNGHLMIAPYQHIGTIEKLPAETLTELMAPVLPITRIYMSCLAGMVIPISCRWLPMSRSCRNSLMVCIKN